jgi:hypothetical protein
MNPTPLRDDERAFRARTLPVELRVSFARSAGYVDTLEGRVRCRPGDAIVTGVRQEVWPVARETFDSNYEPVPPTRMGTDGTYRKRSREVWALELDGPAEVELSSGRGALRGVAGDFLVEYTAGDLAIVGADIFSRAYRRLDAGEG